MPLYEFHCEGCERDFELLVRSVKWQGTPCPHCHSKKLTKKLSVFAQTSAGTTTASPPKACARPGGCGCVGPRHKH